MEEFMNSLEINILKAKEAAIEFRKKFSSKEEFGVDLNDVSEKYSESINKRISIMELDLHEGSKISGFTLINGNNIYICVNSNDSTIRQRFTVAHELGHLFLGDIDVNKDTDSTNIFYRLDLDMARKNPELFAKEQRANIFASELLMPGEQVEKLYEQGISIFEMSGMFGVSKQAMEIAVRRILGL